jgi:predicted phage terminase large subunit-like protein
MLVLPSEAEVRAERCRRSLKAFMVEAWPLVEPATEFVPGWHIDAIAEYLEAATRGEIKRLVINIPPRHMKSLQVSIFWPAWIWLSHPERRFLFASYAQQLSNTHSVACRRLIKTRGSIDPRRDPNELSLLRRIGYRGLVDLIDGRDGWRLTGDQNLKQRFENTRTGFRLATSIGGSVTGEGGDYIVLDDPHKPEEAHSDVTRQKVLDWYDSTWTTRLNSTDGVEVIVMQRLHERDLTGHVLERGGFEHLCLPAEYEPKHPFVWPRDKRERAGAILWGKKWNKPWLHEKNAELGSYGYAGQYQQRPTPAEGGIFKREWWRFYDELPRIDEIVESWDMAFKDTDGSDYVVGQVWGRNLANRYLLGSIRARLDFTATLKAVQDLDAWCAERWPRIGRSCPIEDAANGPAIISALRDHVPSMVPVRPDGGKEARAHAVSPQIEAGNIFLPHDRIEAPPGYEEISIDTFLEETAGFPNGAFDDQVDAMTQALRRMIGTGAPHRLQTDRGSTITGGLLDKEL